MDKDVTAEVRLMDIGSKLRLEKRRYILYITVLIIINTVIFPFLVNSPRTIKENLWTILNANLIGFNILGFLLGVLFAIVPYKGLSYKMKYIRSSLLVILTIQIIMFVGLGAIGIMRLLGWYK